MNRFQTLLQIGLVLLPVWLFQTANAMAYERIVPNQPTGAGPDTVVVDVFFSFNDAKSHLLTKQIRHWHKTMNGNVDLRFIPLANRATDALVHAYYVAKDLNVLGSVEPGLWKLAGQSSDVTEKTLVPLFRSAGVASIDLHIAWRAPRVQDFLDRALATAERFNLHHKVGVIVNGEYRVGLGQGKGVAPSVNEVGKLVNHMETLIAESQ